MWSTESFIYYARQQTAVAGAYLACPPLHGASNCRCSQTLAPFFSHCNTGNFVNTPVHVNKTTPPGWCNACTTGILYGFSFSNFVALCTDYTDTTPVSYDKRIRDFWGHVQFLSPISPNVSSVRTWRRWLNFVFFMKPVSLNPLACLLIVLGLDTVVLETLVEICVLFQNTTFCFSYTYCEYTHVHTLRIPV